MARIRVAKVMPDNSLPSALKVKEPSLPPYLAQVNVATKAELVTATANTLATVTTMIGASQTAILAEVQELINGLGGPGVVFVQNTPVTTIDIDHNFGREIVSVSVFSPDFQTQWEGFGTFPLSENRVRLSFDDAIPFVALIL